MALAAQGGYDAVHMRAVAAQANVAVGTLYRYFPSKAHLLIAALAGGLEDMDLAVDRSSNVGNPAQRLHHVIGSLDQAWQRNPLLTEAVIRAFVFADASAAAEVDRVEHVMDDLFARTMSDGEPTDDHFHIARVISGVWLVNLLAWLSHRASATDVGKRLDLTVRLLVGVDGQLLD